MDAGFPAFAYPSCTLAELRSLRALGTATSAHLDELARREAVEAGDMSKATMGERLRAVRAKLADDERLHQLAHLRTRSPMRSTAPQADAGHLPLFIAGNEPTLI
jgi:hypothetical protein